MADRTCIACGKIFTKPWELQRHFNRKTPCAPILDDEDLPPETREDPDLDRKKCRFCGRVFATNDSMRRHVRTACRIVPNERNGDSGMELLYEHTLLRTQQRENQALRDQVATLAHNVESLTLAMQRISPALLANGETAIAGETAINGNAVVLQDRRQQHININFFGNENTDHITPAKIREILTDSLQIPSLPAAAAQAVMKTAIFVYSDPEHPGNITCYIPNKRDGNALVHGERGWEVRPLQFVTVPMAQKSMDLLFDNQPFEDAEAFEALMVELRDNEARYTTGNEMRTILIRNKDLLTRVLKTLPVVANS